MSQFKTGRGRCPVNGSKRWSHLGPEHRPEFIISYGSPTHEMIFGWNYVGENELGGQMFTIADETIYNDRTNRGNTSLISIQPGQLEQDTHTQSEPLEPKIKHRVYEELLARCPLSSSHRSHLVCRNLPYQELCRLLSFGSLPHPTKRPRLAKQICEELDLPLEDLLKVPGFFINDNNHVSIAGATGLLVPAYDTKGRIQAFQIRKDQVKKDQSRYTWLSSGNKGGVGSGAPGCFLGDRHAKAIWFTEGSIKGAALLTHGWSSSVITVPGVGNVQSALALLDRLESAEQAIVVYDNDWQTKPEVLQGLARLLQALVARGISVHAVTWDPVWGKGIDDAIVKGMRFEDLVTLPLDGVIRGSKKVKYSNPRLESEDLLPIWKPEAALEPTIEELRQETAQVVFDALRKPAGTFSSVPANTGSGKSYTVIHTSPVQTIQMYRNYGALEEAERELRQVYSQGMVRVLYGRIPPPSNPKDTNAQKRFERAGCPHFEAMKQRSERGHSPCKGCPLAPKMNEPKDGDVQNICAYWQQRFKTIEEQPAYLLAVPQSIAANPDLLSLLPKEETRELFGEYGRLVIDDCPEFIQHLIRESSISLCDVKQWNEHPALKTTSGATGSTSPTDLPDLADLPDSIRSTDLTDSTHLHGLFDSLDPSGSLDDPKSLHSESSEKFGDFSDDSVNSKELNEIKTLRHWLKSLLKWFEVGSLPSEEMKSMRESSAQIMTIEKIACEEPTGRDGEILPLKAVSSLASWLARGGGIRFEGKEDSSGPNGDKQHRLFYLRPATGLLECLSFMTICHLDATPDESMLAWFANLVGMNFEAHKMKRRFPPIIQIPDILWDREQVKEQKGLIRAVTEHIHDQGGIVLGFKNREGEEEEHFALDGHWGYSERGFNCFSGVSSMALIGHFSLPTEELNHAAWQMRELSKVMGKPFPDSFVKGTFESKRTYSDPWRPFTREMHVCEDRLVEHMRRHRHTSAVLQGANRPRNFGAPVYLLSGEPLDGLPWDVPVQLWTRQELIQNLGLDLEENQSHQKTLSVATSATNQRREEEALERFVALMPGARAYMKELGKLPGVRDLRRFLAFGKGMVTQKLAYLVRDQLALELATQKTDQQIDEYVGRERNQGDLNGIESSVPDSHLNIINSLTPLSGTPHSISKQSMQDTELKWKIETFAQPEAEIREPATKPEYPGQRVSHLIGDVALIKGPGNRLGSGPGKSIEKSKAENDFENSLGNGIASRAGNSALGGCKVEKALSAGGIPPLERKNLLPISRFPLNRRDVQALEMLSEAAKEDIFALYNDQAIRYKWTNIYKFVKQSFAISMEAFCSLIWCRFGVTSQYMQPIPIE